MNTLEEINDLVTALETEAVFAARGNRGLDGVNEARQSLRTRLTALVADAERYQWLRANREEQTPEGTMIDCYDEDGSLLWYDYLDNAIDAARATQQTKESQ